MSSTPGPEPEAPPPGELPPGGRPSGWNEIAGHLGSDGAGAATSEAPAAGPAPTTERDTARLGRPAPPAMRRAVAAIVLGMLTLPALWLGGGRRSSGTPLTLTSRQRHTPVSWTIERSVLTVRTDDGNRLFERSLGFDTSATPASTDPRATPVEIADIDGDGRSEVLLVAPAIDPQQRRLYCFEDDGSLRFVHQAHGVLRFGDTEYAGPWAAERLFLTRRASGSPALWVASAQPGSFPAWLQELATDGSVRQEYRTDGRITHVSEARWGGRDVVFVGSADRDPQGASVAIFDRDAVAGSTPAARAGYDCTNCGPGGPRELVVFPRLCLTRDGETPGIDDVWVEGGDGLTVETVHRRDPRAEPGTPDALAAYYMFDGTLTLVHAEISREYQLAHKALWRQGLRDHPYTRTEDARLFPVWRFDGHRFVALPAVGVGH